MLKFFAKKLGLKLRKKDHVSNGEYQQGLDKPVGGDGAFDDGINNSGKNIKPELNPIEDVNLCLLDGQDCLTGKADSLLVIEKGDLEGEKLTLSDSNEPNFIQSDIEDQEIVEKLIAEHKIEVIQINSNSRFIKNNTDLTLREQYAIDNFFRVNAPLEPRNKVKKKKNKADHKKQEIEQDVVSQKILHLSTDFIEYSKVGNPFNYDSIFLEINHDFDEYMGCWAKKISQAVKFILPSNGKIIERTVKTGTWEEQFSPYITHFKLPYEKVVFEIDFHNKITGDQHHPMLYYCEQKENHIELTVFIRQLNRWWFIVNRNPIIIKDDFSRPSAILSDALLGDHEMLQCYSAYVDMSVDIVLSFICAINCSNIDILEEIKAGKFINQTRSKKGKPPLFNYRVLTLDFTVQKNAQGDYEHTVGVAKRTHLRRGHIRRLKTKTVWVNSSIVNGQAKGMLNKDYMIKGK